MGEGSVILEAIGAALDLVSNMMDEKAKKKKERAQQEKENQEREQARIAQEKETIRKNQFVGQVFSDVQEELKASGAIKRTLRESSDFHGLSGFGLRMKFGNSIRYVELKDGITAIMVSDGLLFDVPEFSKVTFVAMSKEFSLFCQKYPSLQDISFMSRSIGTSYGLEKYKIGIRCGREKTPEEQYKEDLLSYVQEQHVNSEVTLANLTLCHANELMGANESYVTANFADLKTWVSQTQSNLLRIVDLFNRYLQGEDLSSMVFSGVKETASCLKTGSLLPTYASVSGCENRAFGKKVAQKKGVKLDLVENTTTEFKTSIIFSPEDNQPSSDQLTRIAREVAGFMNTDGGDLYLGVNDDGYVVGIQSDLHHLQDAVIYGQNERSDQDYVYHPNPDGYAQKLQNLARFCLGEIAAKLLDDPEFIHDDTVVVEYVKLHINPSRDKLVYCGKYEDVYIRSGTSVVRLKGAEREDYVSRRFIQ